MSSHSFRASLNDLIKDRLRIEAWPFSGASLDGSVLRLTAQCLQDCRECDVVRGTWPSFWKFSSNVPDRINIMRSSAHAEHCIRMNGGWSDSRVGCGDGIVNAQSLLDGIWFSEVLTISS